MNRRWAGAILALGWVCFLLYAYPGFTSPDSIQQLDEARAGAYTDWHPPAMAFLWRYVDKIWSGTFLMLVLQSSTFLVGTYALIARVLTPIRAAIAAVCIFLFPPVMTALAVIWKDSLMAGLLIAGTAALLSPKRGWRIAACVLIFVATAIRHNALAATLPIVVLLFTWRESWTGWRRYALAIAVWVAITGAASVLNRKLATGSEYAWHNSVALLDIAGTARFSKVQDDAELQALFAGINLPHPTGLAKRIRMLYTGDSHWQLTHGDDRVFDLPVLATIPDVKRAWFRALETYPRAFIYHRWRMFREVIGAGGHSIWASVWYGDEIPSRTPVQHAWVSALFAIRDSALFRVWIYLVLAIALLVMCRARLPLALLASGLVCEVSLAVAAPSADYRYSHWMIVTVVIAGVMIFVQRYRDARVARCRDGSVSHSGSSAPPADSPGSH